MPSQPTERQVADWLVALGPLVAARMTPEEAGARLRAYVPELVARYDTRDFDRTSREFVARHCKFFPSYGELCDLLDKWPKPSQRIALPAPEGSDLDAMDRSWLAFWHKRKAEIWAQQTDFHWKTRDADLANLASLIRQESPKAWREISGAQPARHTPTEREIAAVADTLRKFRDKTPKSAMPEEKPARPEPRYLSDAELERVREARRGAP